MKQNEQMRHSERKRIELEFQWPEAPLNIVLVEPSIPPNTGNISRLCAATASVLHLVEPLGFDLSEKQLRRAGLDYWDSVDLRQYPNLETFFEQNPNGQKFFFSTAGSKSCFDVDYSPGDYLIFGNETVGLPDDLADSRPPVALLIGEGAPTDTRSTYAGTRWWRGPAIAVAAALVIVVAISVPILLGGGQEAAQTADTTPTTIPGTTTAPSLPTTTAPPTPTTTIPPPSGVLQRVGADVMQPVVGLLDMTQAGSLAASSDTVNKTGCAASCGPPAMPWGTKPSSGPNQSARSNASILPTSVPRTATFHPCSSDLPSSMRSVSTSDRCVR